MKNILCIMENKLCDEIIKYIFTYIPGYNNICHWCNNILTKEGVLISDYNFNVFKNKLPIIKGENIDQNIIEILDLLKTNKSMANEIWSLSYINMRRWDLHFKQGLVIRLPSKNPTEAWKLAAKLNQKYNILNLGLTEIDLRNSKQILGKINFDKGLIINRKSS